MPSYDIISLNDFIIRRQKDFPYARGELSSLLHHIGTAAKMVNAKIRKAGLVEILGRFDPKLVKMCPAGEKAED